MNYDECYKMIVDNFKSKINTSDMLLKTKIFNNLLNWYKNNFEDKLKLYCSENNQLGIIYIFKRIEEVCQSDDYTKLNVIYFDKNYEDYIQLSHNIFSLVVDLINNRNINFNDNDYDLYCNKLDEFQNVIHPLLIEDYKFIKSECLLDLLYLKNKGNVMTYSFRTSRLLVK